MTEQEQLQFQPTTIRFQEYTQEELERKLINFRGIISSSIPHSAHASKFSCNSMANAIEAMVLSKVSSSIVGQKIFINFYNRNKEWIETYSYLKITFNLESINKFICDIHKAVRD